MLESLEVGILYEGDIGTRDGELEKAKEAEG